MLSPRAPEIVGPEWHAPREFPRLAANEVHVWRASVTACEAALASLVTLLDAAEAARADRFHFARDRRQYVVAHAMLRTVLSGYAGQSPASLRFTTGAAGKPSLVPSGGAPPVAFNLSHSGDLILLGVGASAVGVDVERWAEGVEAAEVAQHFFSPTECADLLALAPEQRVAGFFACWSRKEAYIKATGVGVTAGLDYFDVVVDAAHPARLAADRRDPGAERRWRMLDLVADAGYSAALVVPAPTERVRLYEYSAEESPPLPGDVP